MNDEWNDFQSMYSLRIRQANDNLMDTDYVCIYVDMRNQGTWFKGKKVVTDWCLFVEIDYSTILWDCIGSLSNLFTFYWFCCFCVIQIKTTPLHWSVSFFDVSALSQDLYLLLHKFELKKYGWRKTYVSKWSNYYIEINMLVNMLVCVVF
jgi:hypothetical protein